MKKFLLLFSILGLIIACGDSPKQTIPPAKPKKEEPKKDYSKGIGDITEVKLNNPLNQEWAAKGKAIYDLKCSACHKTSAQRVVGPGFKGVTDRRKPEWIMNMTTNVEAMLEEDPTARDLLKQCLVRMPNQNLTKEDARNILEWMFVNDSDKG